MSLAAHTPVSADVADKIDGMKFTFPNEGGKKMNVRLVVNEKRVPYLTYLNGVKCGDSAIRAAVEREVAAFLNKNKASSSKVVDEVVKQPAKRQHQEEEEEGDEMEGDEDSGSEADEAESEDEEVEVPKAKGKRAVAKDSISIANCPTSRRSGKGAEKANFSPSLIKCFTKETYTVGKNECEGDFIHVGTRRYRLKYNQGNPTKTNPEGTSPGIVAGNGRSVNRADIPGIVRAIRAKGHRGDVPFSVPGANPQNYH